MFKKFIPFIAFVSSFSAFASIQHPTCEIYPNAKIIVSGYSSTFDWSAKNELVRIFEDSGYRAKPDARPSSKMIDGDLYTDLAVFCRAERDSWTGSVTNKCAAALRIDQVDSKAKGGFVVLGNGATNREYSSSALNDAVAKALANVIHYVPRCEKKVQ